MKIENLFFPVDKQLKILKNNKRYADIIDAAGVTQGISQLSADRKMELMKIYESFEGQVVKFVPASGAASRMFKHVYDLENKKDALVSKFIENISRFPFHDLLKGKCLTTYGLTPAEMIKDEKLKELTEIILGEEGLSYSNLPKGLIPFYKTDKVYTPFEIHVNESVHYAHKKEKARIHFTVSPNHVNTVRDLLNAYVISIDKVSFEIDYSIQMPETDTVALNQNCELVKDDSQNELLRPGGHGALIHNLNQIQSDIVFIKNIDNVVKESSLKSQSEWKKTLGGALIELQKSLFRFQSEVDNGEFSSEAILFLKRMFGYSDVSDENLKKVLFRPVRVCGMVKNEGQPGGGPFYVNHKETGKALQIVESVELDELNQDHQNALARATHFNPVDLVCGIRNYKGEKFDLLKFVDNDSCFTSKKNFLGEEITVLELPGLWNGAMADWNTLFIEVPADTFNPVKTVNDLLKESYQG